MSRSAEFASGIFHTKADDFTPAPTDRRAGALPYPQTEDDALWEEQEARRARSE